MSDINIGLLWHTLESGNHGVNALTVSNVAIARTAAEAVGLTPRFVYFAPGLGRVDPMPDGNGKIVRLNRETIVSSGLYRAAVDELDCMLDISAGDSFADIYGAKRFFWMWRTKDVAIRRGVPLMLSPQTIGPFERQPYRWLAGRVMRRAALTIARDPLSYEAVERLAPGAPRLLATDVAFRLPFARRPRTQDGKIHVGINVSGLLWEQSGSGGNSYGLSYDYAAMTTRLLDPLVARGEVTVHLLTHVVDPNRPLDSDSIITDTLAQRYPNAIRVPDFVGPSEAKSYISGLDFLAAARMHACIAAFSSGVPVVPVAYSRKFMGLFGELLGYPHTLTPKGFDEAEAAAFVLDRIDRRDDLQCDIDAGNAKVAPLLERYDAALRDLFTRAQGRRKT